jgi:hypothetical protein
MKVISTLLKRFLFCFSLLIVCNISAQEKNSIFLNAGFLQLKDDFNQGMVFNGPQINIQYQRHWDFSTLELSYKPKIALGVPFSRGMMAVNINLVPINVSCLKTIFEIDKHRVKAGLNFATNYNYQSYPYLQNPHLFWFGKIGLSPCFEYQYKWNTSSIKMSLQNSILGFVSHTTRNDPYFYSFKFTDFLIRPHENMKFGSFDKYDHTCLEIEYTPNIAKPHSLGLGAESYTKDPNDITQRTAIWSCTKQVTAILTGIAIEQGLIGSVNDNLQQYLPKQTAKHQDKGLITIENLLKMQSGIAFNNEGFNGESSQLLRGVPDNSLEFLLRLPMSVEQGLVYNYNDGNMGNTDKSINENESSTYCNKGN